MLPHSPTQGRRLQAWPGRPCHRAHVFCIVGALMLLMGLPAPGWAQSGVTVTGVVENETGAVVPDVRCTLTPMTAGTPPETAGTPLETVGDMLGRFLFSNVLPGRYVLKVQAQETESLDLVVSTGLGPLAPLKITLKGPGSDTHNSGLGLIESADITGNLAEPLRPPVVVEQTSPSTPARGQDGSATTLDQAGSASTTGAQSAPGAPGGQKQPPQVRVPTLPRLWSVGFSVSNSYDNNIDHDLANVKAYSLGYGTSLAYQSNLVRPLFRVAYDLTRYSVPGAGRWTRLSHHLRTTVERRLNRRVYVDLVGDFLTAGSSEDREIANQYLLRPRVEFRLPRDHRLRFYAAHRLKRYPNTVDRDTTNRYVGLELQRRFESGDSFQIGYRYEETRGTTLRQRYRRLTYETDYTTVLTERDTVTFQVVYRSQIYPYKLADLHNVKVPRHNQRWNPSLSWGHRIGAHVEARLDYVFETQSSNDLDEPFTAHNIGFSFGFML